MKLPSVRCFFILLLVFTLVISLFGNLSMYRACRYRHANLQAALLDPLGLETHIYDVDSGRGPMGEASIRVVFFGDSRAFHWATPTRSSGTMYINRGISGQTSAQVAARYSEHVAPLNADILVLQVGINDLKAIPLLPERLGWIIDRCKENIAQIVASARRDGMSVILTTIFPRGPLPLVRRPVWSGDVDAAVTEVNAFIANLAGDGVYLIGTREILARGGDRVLPEYRLDFLHINGKGYAVLNDALEAVLAEIKNEEADYESSVHL